MSHHYDSRFMSYADVSSRASAERIARLLLQVLPIRSVLDVGCAKGTWLQVWDSLGAVDIQGVDGSYVRSDQLRIPADRFHAADLSQPLNLGRRFDLVQSLEVAEHIDSASAKTFIESLTRHSNGIILFSAAPPGQGGEFHINEQPYDYWRSLFGQLGFHAHDWIRPQIAGDAGTSFWYRYNSFLYVHQSVANSLPPSIASSRVDPLLPLADVSPRVFQWRKRAVRLLPNRVRDGLARFKAKFLPSGRW